MKPATDDIRQEPLISKSWNFKLNEPSTYSPGILITGANSFIGCHVISLLQAQWAGNIHLLLRSATRDEALIKMNTSFKTWKLQPFESERFVIHCGDVFKDKMGLDEKEYDEMNSDTGMVLHLAMNPLYHLPYKRFRHWLPELEHMISFCGNHQHPKRLHYPSSYNANFFTGNEDFEQLNTNAWQSGYAGFKWVANKVLQNVFRQNLKGCLYDIPLVVGSRSKGVCPENYSIWHILDLFRETGYYIDFEFKIIPVDILARIIVTNMMNDLKGEGQQFVRPVLKDAVSDRLMNKTMAFILGLKHTDREHLLMSCSHKRICNFMIPDNFYTLLGKVNSLEAEFPTGFDEMLLPGTYNVFYSNLKKTLSKQRILL